jgi:hypothetical protein
MPGKNLGISAMCHADRVLAKGAGGQVSRPKIAPIIDRCSFMTRS